MAQSSKMKSAERWFYYCTQRPACPGAIPRGVVKIEDMDPDIPVDGLSKGAYSLIGYDRELAPNEVFEYELAFAYRNVTG